MNMNCGNCGFRLDTGAAFCGNCGFKIVMPGEQPQVFVEQTSDATRSASDIYQQQPMAQPVTDDKSTPALILGIVSIPMALTLVAIPIGVAAIIMGSLALKSNKGKSVAAIITGILGILLSIVIIAIAVSESFKGNS